MDRQLLDAVLRAGAGSDQSALRDLDGRIRPGLLRYFRRGPWPSSEAEDLVQTTLALVFRHMERLQDRERFLPWLYTIARNVRSTAVAEWSTRQRIEGQPIDPERPPRMAPALEETAGERERRAALGAAFEQLPPRQRQCLLLRVREEMSYEEIAATLRLSTNTVRNHIAQAKESLRHILGSGKGSRR